MSTSLAIPVSRPSCLRLPETDRWRWQTDTLSQISLCHILEGDKYIYGSPSAKDISEWRIVPALVAISFPLKMRCVILNNHFNAVKIYNKAWNNMIFFWNRKSIFKFQYLKRLRKTIANSTSAHESDTITYICRWKSLCYTTINIILYHKMRVRYDKQFVLDIVSWNHNLSYSDSVIFGGLSFEGNMIYYCVIFVGLV